MSFEIRWLIRRDMPRVLQIEKASFTIPWEEEDFLFYLRQRTCIGLVVEHCKQVEGYVIYELDKRTLHLLNLAVSPDNRRTGIGTAILDKLKDKLSQIGRTDLMMTVRENNVPSQLFLRTQDFRAISSERGHYEDTGEDGIIFRYSVANRELAGRP